MEISHMVILLFRSLVEIYSEKVFFMFLRPRKILFHLIDLLVISCLHRQGRSYSDAYVFPGIPNIFYQKTTIP